jgi:hypothetical protein
LALFLYGFYIFTDLFKMARKYNNLPEIEEKTSFEKLKEEYK